MTDRNEPESEEAAQAGDEELPPDVARLHGVAFFLAENLRPGEGDEAFAALDEETLLEIAAFLHHLTEKEDGTEELLHATHTIASFVAGNKADSPQLAEQVTTLLELPFVVEAISKWSIAADPEQVKKVAEKFGSFSDIDSSKKAPKVGEEKPEGAVDLNALNFPKRL